MIGKNLLLHRFKIRKGKSRIIVTDLLPVRETGIPIIFAPGWGATCLFYERIFFALRDSGRRVIGVEGVGEINDAPESWPRHETGKAAAILETMDHLNIPKADLMGQSAGAFPVTLASTLWPERFRHLILITPAGYMGRVPFPRMMMSWLTNNAGDPLTRPIMAKNAGIMPSILKNIFSNLSVSIKEIRTVLNFPLEQFIPVIRQNGVSIAVLYGENDTIISPALLLPRIKDVDLVMPMLGPHGSLILLPLGTEKVLETLKRLENIQKQNILI